MKKMIGQTFIRNIAHWSSKDVVEFTLCCCLDRHPNPKIVFTGVHTVVNKTLGDTNVSCVTKGGVPKERKPTIGTGWMTCFNS
ncbi:hypothetical protein GJAV_G00134380 [Gymnothorax javanicus]|nr:hypothetical protein GJAV_G00134380 [Gymnothorax javanicus]